MSVKNLIARAKVNRLKQKMQMVTFDFPASLQKPKSVLVCLPGELRELTLVKQFLPRITEVFKPAPITLLAMPGLMITDIFPRKGFSILTPTTDQITWSGVAKKSYLQMLAKEKFDLILDLNFNPSWFTSSILLNFPQAVRVGRGNHLGKPYYNLEIKTKYLRDERNIYRSLLETLQLLKESHSTEKQHR
ncbi:MAG: hypothetical protein DRP47_09530 [Candidatus Zixiibacteriota bacterium]|nr:MAG: hypothetical protein DRP47_09530 [candidate division Zixibacteria bacterium]